MSGIKHYNDEEFDFRENRKVSSDKKKPIRKLVEEQLIQEGEYQGFSNFDDLDRYCDSLELNTLKDEEISGDENDLANIPGVSYSVRW